jgi:hypothetical protein
VLNAHTSVGWTTRSRRHNLIHVLPSRSISARVTSPGLKRSAAPAWWEHGMVRASILTAVLLSASSVQAQDCLHRANESVSQRARREAAIRYLAALNQAQAASQQKQRAYLSLSEAAGSEYVPVGFLPRLLSDQWGYLVSLKDFFDPCGFTLFSDDRGVIYESHPSVLTGSAEPATSAISPNGGRRSESATVEHDQPEPGDGGTVEQ